MRIVKPDQEKQIISVPLIDLSLNKAEPEESDSKETATADDVPF
jgi:hypothetical protein